MQPMDVPLMDSAKGGGGVTGVPPAFGMALLSFQFVLIVLYALCTEDLYERQYMEVSSTDNKTMIHDPLTDEILYRNYVDVALFQCHVVIPGVVVIVQTGPHSLGKTQTYS